jgi:hypothetical protein
MVIRQKGEDDKTCSNSRDAADPRNGRRRSAASGKKRGGLACPPQSRCSFGAFLAVQVVGTVLSFLYFAAAGMVLSLPVALLLGLAAWLARN